MLAFTAFSSVAGAYCHYDPYCGKLTRGVYNRTYTNHMGGTYYQNLGKRAIADWNWAVNSSNNGVGVDVYFKSASSGAAIEMWGDLTVWHEWYGYTNHYVNNTMVHPKNQNYNKTAVILNIPDMESQNLSYEKRKGTLNHEIGHALGLAHTNVFGDKGNLMYSGQQRTAQVPTADDVTGIKKLYS